MKDAAVLQWRIRLPIYYILYTKRSAVSICPKAASRKSFFKIIDSYPADERTQLLKDFDLDADLGPSMKEYSKFVITTAISNALKSYEDKIPACIYMASVKRTFGQAFNDYAEEYAAARGFDDEPFLRYCDAYEHVRGKATFDLKKVEGKLVQVENSTPTAEDWALFKEMTGLTKEDLPAYKEGESNAKR